VPPTETPVPPTATPVPPTATPVPPPVINLEGTRWNLLTYQNAAGQSVTLLPGTSATAQFVSGNVSGLAGCNTYNGGYTVSGDSLTMNGPLITTQQICSDPAGLMDQEQAYLAALSKASRYSISGTTLTIFDSNRRPILSLAAPQVQPL